MGTKLKQCFADFEVQSKKHMKEKFLADLNKIRDNKSGDDLADGLYFFIFLRYCFTFWRWQNLKGYFFVRPIFKKIKEIIFCQLFKLMENLIDCF